MFGKNVKQNDCRKLCQVTTLSTISKACISLQTNFNDRLQTNQGVIEHPALPVCWTSDV